MILTVGHSTHPLEGFLAMLRAHGVAQIIDVRTVPRSARNPQFNRESLPGELAAVGIAYTHTPELGGLRKARADSTNLAWRNESFRGYADYMQTLEFDTGLRRLIEIANGRVDWTDPGRAPTWAAGRPPGAVHETGALHDKSAVDDNRGAHEKNAAPPSFCTLMCAEALPWRCHRSLIADALTARGVPVEHIISATARQPHEVTPFARVEGARVTYPALGL
jgi:uncharacterized protein (DUF488 family)